MLGLDEEQRIASMAAMLRNSDEDEIAEMARVFGLAMERAAEEDALAKVAERVRSRDRTAGIDDDGRSRQRRSRSAGRAAGRAPKGVDLPFRTKGSEGRKPSTR